jgi:hypothetical protein
MPEFVNPFTGVVAGRKPTDAELLRALRLDPSAEHLYPAHAHATDNEPAIRWLHSRFHTPGIKSLFLMSPRGRSVLPLHCGTRGTGPPNDSWPAPYD